MTKHSYPDFPPPELVPAKRIKPSWDVQRFTEAEQWTLQGAAKILKVRLEDLLTAVDTSQLPSRNPSTPESRQTPSVSSRDDQHESVQSSLSSNSLEAAWLSTMSRYEHSASPKTQFTNNNAISEHECFSNLEAATDVDSISSMQGWHDVFPGLDLPNYERAPALGGGQSWTTFNDAAIALPPIEGDLLHSDNPGPPPVLIVSQDTLKPSTPIPDFHPGQLASFESIPDSVLLNPPCNVPNDPVRQLPEQHHNNHTNPSPQKPTAGKKGRRKGPFQDQLKRDETALTRHNKACISCSMQKIRV